MSACTGPMVSAGRWRYQKDCRHDAASVLQNLLLILSIPMTPLSHIHVLRGINTSVYKKGRHKAPEKMNENSVSITATRCNSRCDRYLEVA